MNVRFTAVAVAVAVALVLAGCSAAPAVPTEPVTVTDPTGDAVSGPDLTQVSVQVLKSGDLEATWTLAGPVPATGLVGLYLAVASPDGQHSGQVGVKLNNGQTMAQFVFLDGTNHEQPLPVTKVEGNRVTTVISGAPLKPLGKRMQWNATVTADGMDSDTAPDPGPNARATITLR